METGESSGSAEDHIKWQEQDDQAKAATMSPALADDLTMVTDAASAQGARYSLKTFYGRETANTTINLLKDVT